MAAPAQFQNIAPNAPVAQGPSLTSSLYNKAYKRLQTRWKPAIKRAHSRTKNEREQRDNGKSGRSVPEMSLTLRRTRNCRIAYCSNTPNTHNASFGYSATASGLRPEVSKRD